MIARRYRLSHDEVLLLEHIAGGTTNDKIAEILVLAEKKTVKRRIQRLYKKLGVKGRVPATIVAAQFGLVAAEGTAPEVE